MAGTHGRNEEGGLIADVEIDYLLPLGHRNNYLIIFDDVFVPSVSRSLSLVAFIEMASRSIVFVTEPLRHSG
ncbi:MAG: hypothetical protein NO076_06740 [Sulfolobales archaeon]|nr:hypothetical protein [Sulfolobales archaeon]